MDDRSGMETIILEEAKDIARQAEDDGDENFLPWGGRFLSPCEERRRGPKFAAGQVGEC